MKFQAKFLTSVRALTQCPEDGKPEIALIGRSNVGKSTLLNAIVEQKQLAKTSSTAGKTQLINYFTVNDSFYLVDMPGYGYARAAKDDRVEWAKVSEQYFLTRKTLVAVGILIDARHETLENDVAAVEWFAEKKIPFFLVLTKIDKVKQQDVARHERLLKTSVFPALGTIKTSSVKKKGIGELRALILKLLAE